LTVEEKACAFGLVSQLPLRMIIQDWLAKGGGRRASKTSACPSSPQDESVRRRTRAWERGKKREKLKETALCKRRGGFKPPFLAFQPAWLSRAAAAKRDRWSLRFLHRL